MPSPPGLHGAVDNRLLATLPAEEYHRLLPQLEPVAFTLGHVVYEAGRRLPFVYFPTTAVVSLLSTLASGMTAEMGLTGNDGVVGVALFLGGDTTPNRAVIQVAGGALQMKARVLREEFARGGAFQQALPRYTQALISPRSPRRRSVTASTPWSSGSAAGCCSATTTCGPRSCG